MNSRAKYLVVLALCLLQTAVFSAVNKSLYKFHNLTPQMGLSEANVSSVFRDHQGFLWIGTYDGLNKYDGVGFQLFQYDKEDLSSLSNNSINVVFEDSNKNLWVGTNHGLNKYNRKLDNFERIKLITWNENEVVEVKEIFEDSKGGLWVAANTGVYKYSQPNNAFDRVLTDYYTNVNLPFCEDIAEDTNGNMWFGFSDQLIKHETEGNRVTVYNNKNSEIKLGAAGIICIHVDTKNSIWIGYYNSGLEKLNIETDQLKSYKHNKYNISSLSNNYVMSIVEDSLNNIWVGTDKGLNIYYEPDDSFIEVTATDNQNSLLTNIIQCSYVDAEGSLYFGCRGGGVSIYDDRLSKFKKFVPQVGSLNSLSSSSVIAFAEDANRKIWIAVDGGGVNYFNPHDYSFKHFKHDKNNKKSLTNNKVLAVLTDNDDGLWAGMWQGGLCYFRIDNDSLIFQRKYLKVNNNDPESMSVFDLYKSPDGDIWVGTYGSGPFKYNNQTQNFDHVKLNTNTNKNFKYQSVVDMLDDGEGNMWFCTLDDGLVKYDKNTGAQKLFVTNDSITNGLPSMAVNAIIKDNSGNIWLGTANGLSLFDQKKQIFKTFTVKHGLPSNLIYGLLADDEGKIWCSTNRGLAEVELNAFDSIAVKVFTVTDGLQDNYFNPWAYFKSSTGSLYFGGIKGFNTFNPTNINFNTIVPQVHITNFLLFNKPVTNYNSTESVLKMHIKETDEITLTHKQFNFSFQFRALNLINSEQNTYAYIMENLEDDWNYVGHRKNATYTKIPHGEYVFRVKAANNDGVWNEDGTAVKIKILPPWYKTLLFKLVMVLIVVIMARLGYIVRIRSLKDQKKMLEIKVKQRTEDLEMAYVELENKQNEIKHRNDELLASQEELQQLNEELSVTNDHLFYQKEELELALNNLKETQAQLIQSEKMASLGILTSGIAHEINNPLNFIQGGKFQLQMQIKEQCPENVNKFKAMFDIIDEGIKRATNIISSLNQFNRKTENYNEKCDIHDIIKNCLLILHSKMEFRIEVCEDFNSETINVIGNNGELHQVFLNIINNSVQSIEGNGVINIKTEILNNDKVIVEISDNGKGIAPENLNKVTSPFFTTKDPGEGTGLGMSIAYSIIKKHNGTIKYSSNLGQGTVVALTFPV